MAFDPATLSLSGWWRADYPGAAPWTPTASAGGSGSNGNLVTAGSDPGNGPTQNGLTPASFDGASQFLKTANAPTTYLTVGAGTIIVLADVEGVPVDSGTSYLNPTLCGTQFSVEAEMTVSDGGFVCHLYDGSHIDTPALSFSTGAYHLFAFTWDSTTVRSYVDTATASIAGGAIDTLGFPCLNVGATYDDTTAFAQANKLEIITASTALSAATIADIGRYFQDRYAISLGFPSLDAGIEVGRRPFRGMAARGPVRHMLADKGARLALAAPFLAVGIASPDLSAPVAGSPTGSGPIRHFRPNPLGRTPGDAAPFKAVGTVPRVMYGAPNRDGIKLQFPQSPAYLPGDAAPFLAVGTVPVAWSGHPAGIIGPARDFRSQLGTFNVSAPSGDISGTATIVFAQSAAIAAQADVAATNGITFGQSGTIAAQGDIAASTAITFGQAGTISATAALGGSSPIVFGQSGTISARADIAGSSPIIFGQTGDLRGTGPDIGISQAGVRNTARPWAGGPFQLPARSRLAFVQGSPTSDISGTATIIFGQSGAVAAQADAQGSAAITFAQSAAIAAQAAVAGSTTIIFGQSGAIAAQADVLGTTTVVFGATGDLRGTGPDIGVSQAGVRNFGPQAGGPFRLPARSRLGYVTVVPSGDISGTATIAFGQSGAIAATANMSASATIVFGQSGAIAAMAGISGTATILFGATGQLSALRTGRWFILVFDD